MSFRTEGVGSGAHELRAISAGAYALQRLRACSRGSVVAKFEHSLYVRFESGAYVCVGAQPIGQGPLNILLTRAQWSLAGAGPLEERIEACDGALLFADRVRVQLTRATHWQPRQTRMQREDALKHLPSLLARGEHNAPEAGLSRLAFAQDADENPLLAFARPAWDALEVWLARSTVLPGEKCTPAPETSRLIGLGPGLTPSGDDVFCGVLIALETLGFEQPAEVLWRWLQPQLEQRTSALSAAHMRAAAAGHGHEALHHVLECLPQDVAALDQALRALSRIGHSSGWDALAGVVLVCRNCTAHAATSRVASSAACAFDGATVTPALSNIRHCAE